jgi:hypothetical protein
MTELVGPYIVYKRTDIDNKISVHNIEKDCEKGKIKLENMLLAEDDKKYVNFFRIPKTSFLSIKSRKQDFAGKYYDNLL